MPDIFHRRRERRELFRRSFRHSGVAGDKTGLDETREKTAEFLESVLLGISVAYRINHRQRRIDIGFVQTSVEFSRFSGHVFGVLHVEKFRGRMVVVREPREHSFDIQTFVFHVSEGRYGTQVSLEEPSVEIFPDRALLERASGLRQGAKVRLCLLQIPETFEKLFFGYCPEDFFRACFKLFFRCLHSVPLLKSKVRRRQNSYRRPVRPVSLSSRRASSVSPRPLRPFS